MLVPKKNRLATYSYLFKGTLFAMPCNSLFAFLLACARFFFLVPALQLYVSPEGVLVCKKDTVMPKHPQIEVPNLQVMKMMLSLKSREYVKEVFSWQHYFYSLTDQVPTSVCWHALELRLILGQYIILCACRPFTHLHMLSSLERCVGY